MRTLRYAVLLTILISLLSCDKSEDGIITTFDVPTYIELLKSDQYDSLDLPKFTYSDIPVLLQYRNETQVITKFPVNPISSTITPQCTLGTYVLWTIESVRLQAISTEKLSLSFPSKNPVLITQNANYLNSGIENIAQIIAAKAYYDWWENNKEKNFDEFKNIDPLAGTGYKWY